MKRILQINQAQLILILLATSPAFALGTYGSNQLLISFMYFAPVLFSFSFRLYRFDFLLLAFAFSLPLFQVIFNFDSLRWSTIVFTFMYVITFLLFKRHAISGKLKLVEFLHISKGLIFAYSLVLLVQQVCVFLSIPIFIVSNYHPEDPYKLNSLMSEPSHSARVLAILMYGFITVREIGNNRRYNLRFDGAEDKLVWIAFLWSMFTMGSGAAFVFFFIVMLKFIRVKTFLYSLPVFLTLVLSLSLLGLTGFDRSLRIILSLFTFDSASIIEADASGAYRIIPFFILLGKVGFLEYKDWLGYGVDYVASFMSYELPGLPEGATAGGLLQLWMDFGFISFIMFILYNFYNCLTRIGRTGIFLWISIVLLQGINNQITWLLMATLTALDNFKKEQHYEKK